MRDMFDEFMNELRRRQEAATGGSGDPGPTARPAGDDADELSESDPEDARPLADGDEDVPEGPEPTPIDVHREAPGTRRGPTPGRRSPYGRGPGRFGSGGPGGPRRPGGPDDGARSGGRGRRIGLTVVIAAIVLILVLGGSVVNFVTDAIWYKSVGYDSVFWTRILTQGGLFVGAFTVALVFLLGGLWLADKAVPAVTGGGDSGGSLLDRLVEAAQRADGRISQNRGGGDQYQGRFGSDESRFERPVRPGGPAGPAGQSIFLGGEELPSMTPIVRIGLVVVAVLFALGIAGTVAGQWETIQLWIHQVPYAVSGTPVTDPIFGRDIGFFLFQLPFLRLAQSLATSLLIGGLFLAGGRFLVGIVESGLTGTTRVRVHIGFLGGLLLILVALGYQLDKLELVYSNRGFATGVSFTDQHAQFIAFDALTVIAALAGAFLVGAAFTRWVWPLGLVVVAWLAASFVLGTIYPTIIQKFTVEPNQFAQEQPYITNNLSMTRLAFGLGDWTPTTPFSGEAPLTQSVVDAEAATFQNARLWDNRPLGNTLDQLQTIRQYYDFTDVDTDRYMINGQLRQVMLSARELAPDKNPQAASWVNQKITFTHGIGAAMVPVNQATAAGLPDLIIKDLPPISTGGAPTITQPRIYFGERPSDYVVVDAKQPAFDYPVGTEANGGTSGTDAPAWTGTSGIKLDTILSRLLFSIRFRDVNLLISDQVTADSQLLFHRSLSDRLGLIAPFLRYDSDPYLVVDNGRLVYIQDAYTISDKFPNAQSFDGSSLGSTSGLAGDSFDYIRNSVKIVMDAYDGSMTFYMSDPSDPIIRAYEGVFPNLFTSIDKMPAELQAHLRTPEEIFNVQTAQFAKYHVTNASTFFQGNDIWTVPTAPASDQSLPPQAYYVVMRLPDGTKPEFLLVQPMVPRSRPNMIAWVAARNDGADRGQVRVFQFPQDTSVLGPTQIAAKIDIEPTISSQVSLWHQAGSSVIKGNLIVIPLQDSLIYLQPIYLQSTSTSFPQLEKIVLATSTTVVWGNTLQEALNLLLAGGFNGTPNPTPTPTPTPGSSPGVTPAPTPSGGPVATPPADVQALVAYANQHFELAQAALKNGDFATYGTEIGLVQQALQRLDQLVGPTLAPSTPSPVPSAGASPSP